MLKRFACCGILGSALLQAGLASAQPSFCPTTTPAPCSQIGAEIGDLLVTLHGDLSLIVGLRPSTGSYYVFSSALIPDPGATELGDIAVLPNNPVETVVIGNVDNRQIGVRRLDACGQLASLYGTFPSTWPAPWPSIQKAGTSNRGLIFNPLDAQLFSPGMTATYQTYPYPTFGTLFRFPIGGGSATIVPASGALVDASPNGAAAADEFGNLYLGDNLSPNISKIPASGLLNGAPVEIGLGSPWLNSIQDIVHDGNNHLFVTDIDWSGHGKVWRFNLNTGTPEPWTDNRGPAYGSDPFNHLFGITIDGSGDLWVVEQYSAATNRAGVVKISGKTGQVLGYYQMPPTFNGNVSILSNGPWDIAVYGVNLPAVRERCAVGSCAATDVSDCYGGCVPAAALGDGVCDAGPDASLSCYARGFDLGDCNPCAYYEAPDCNGNCGPKSWIGDGICDQSGPISYWNGAYISYDCQAFRFDEATCRGCNAGEMLDCNGNCAPAHWFGDHICDAGGYSYYGIYVDFDCVEYDFDQHTCQ